MRSLTPAVTASPSPAHAGQGSAKASASPRTAVSEVVDAAAAGYETEALSAQEVLARALADHHPRMALASSFQKEETVLVHMLLQIVPDARVFTIDTGVLFPET